MGLIEFFELFFYTRSHKIIIPICKKLTLLVNQGGQKTEVNF